MQIPSDRWFTESTNKTLTRLQQAILRALPNNPKCACKLADKAVELAEELLS
jgi:hypothetical protein